MIISPTRIVITVLGGWAVLLLPIADAQDSPHWSKSGCPACHLETQPVGEAINLKETDTETLCESCHGDRGSAIPCRHVSGVVPKDSGMISTELRASLFENQVACLTCHDVVYQCERPKQHYRYENLGFLRDRTSREESDYCLKCHDSSDYQKLNPHEIVFGQAGRLTCQLCHQDIPKTDDDGTINARLNMESDLNDACRGCHVVAPHPRGLYSIDSPNEWVHLTAPSAKVMANMEEAKQELGITLPLNPTNGEIFCSTCHNQHGFSAGAANLQPQHRLRANDICQVCHDK